MTPEELDFFKFSKKIDIVSLIEKVPDVEDLYIIDLYPPEIINSKQYRLLLLALRKVGIDQGLYFQNIQSYWNKYIEIYKQIHSSYDDE